ncbi:hypothetical protein Sfum_2484 [Syntrophobacter fumaroxidans MPOB]|uniref:Transposase DDE domain-containing protein n=1 Tax=Syntrophobacter fumaroxidans (strain DSM 10017 / MPOB) TaxID=335543 RepID=A0LL62_SYNFM|nr:hypothetical protein Sfum_2484 [Syntrophobacter fumaroxidans MPOB]
MKTVCHNQLSFANLDSRSVVAEFSAGPMTSDGGSLLLREIDVATTLSSSMSRALCDRRDQAKVQHGQEELLRQRLFAITMGYEDGNDHQSLRFDPGLKTAVGSLPETGPALASQPTISRFSPSEIQQFRAQRAESVLEEFRVWMEKRATRTPPKGLPGKALN